MSEHEIKRTAYGFEWGPAEVARVCEHNGQVVLAIVTARGVLDVRVTRTGHIRTSMRPAPKGKKP